MRNEPLRPGEAEEARLAKRLVKGAASVADGEYPTVPEPDRKDSPGTVLAVRLAARLTPGQVLRYEGLGLLVLGAALAAVAGALYGVSGLRARPPALFLGAVAGLRGVGWLVLLFFFLRQWRIVRGVGPTVVEVSAFPLVAGEPARLYLSQSGPLRVESLHVTLVCEESAKYRQGTDTRTEKRCVFRGDVHCAARFAIDRERPYEGRWELAVPGTAMHSFRSAHNEVCWKVVVEAELEGLPRYSQEYPLVVRPPLRREERS